MLLSFNSFAFIGGASSSSRSGWSSGSSRSSTSYSRGSRSSSPHSHYHYSSSAGSSKATWQDGIVLGVPTVIVGLFHLVSRGSRRRKNKERFNDDLNWQRELFISHCRHTVASPQNCYTISEREQAIQALSKKAVDKLYALSKKNYLLRNQQVLVGKVKELFLTFQQAWSDRDIERVAKLCCSKKYLAELDKQIKDMIRLRVYNHLLETQIDECCLIEVLSKKKFSMPLLRFAVKGSQYDEYNAYSQIENRDIYSKRNFNCLIDVALKGDDVFVHNILIDQHVDDYIMNHS